MSSDDIISLLQTEIESRRLKNKSYSLRAASRDIDIHVSILSQLLKRKRTLNSNYKKKIFSYLKLSDEQIEMITKQSENKIVFTQVELDIIRSISDWYHDAIIELLRTKGVKSNADYIAKRLGITEQEAEAAISRLMNLGIIKKQMNKTWSVSFDNTLIYGNDTTNFALQTLQRQLLEKAIEAIKIVPKKDREQASMTMAINKKDLPKAKELIKKFHKELCEFLQRPNRDSDEVFQLITSFFPLTK